MVLKSIFGRTVSFSLIFAAATGVIVSDSNAGGNHKNRHVPHPPKTTFFIRLQPNTTESFTLEAGCVVIRKRLHFEPGASDRAKMVYPALVSFESAHPEAIAGTVQLGGMKYRSLRFYSSHLTIPSPLEMQFPSSDEGLTSFRRKLKSMLVTSLTKYELTSEYWEGNEYPAAGGEFANALAGTFRPRKYSVEGFLFKKLRENGERLMQVTDRADAMREVFSLRENAAQSVDETMNALDQYTSALLRTDRHTSRVIYFNK